MPVDMSVVGRVLPPHKVTWTATQAIIYALGVGAGAVDPTEELAFTTENTEGVPQQVLPTFAAVLGSEAPRPSYGDIDRRMTVHAEQGMVFHRALSPEGEGELVRSVRAIYDKGSGALVVMRAELRDGSGALLAEIDTSAFIRGEGNFGGERGPKSSWEAPDRSPDIVVEQQTRIDQPLLYRLSGDRNPLHSDPKFAAAGGWPRPILHGMCTYGFVGRAVLAQVDHDPARLKSLKVRFSSPVLPGDLLRTTMWRDGNRLSFRTYVADRLVLDAGEAELAS